MEKNRQCCDSCDSCGSCSPNGGTCAAGNSCGYGCRHKSHWGKIALKIVLVAIIFWIGMKFGEQRAFMELAQFGGFPTGY